MAAIVVAALPLAACGGGSAELAQPTPAHIAPDTTVEQTTAEQTAPTPSTTSNADGATADVSGVPADAQHDRPSTDAYDRLDAAMVGLGTSYTFETVATIDGADVAIATGRRVDDATEIELAQKGTIILYRAVGSRRWVQFPDGQWKSLSTSTAPSDPLRQIDRPSHLDIRADDGNTVTMVAIYDADAFALDSTSDIEVTLTLDDDALTRIEYETQQSGRVARVRTAFRPVEDPEPIAAP